MLYICGKTGATANSASPNSTLTATESAVSCHAILRALTSRPAPSSCPTMMPVAPPSDMNACVKTFATVWEMFIAAMMFRPRTE